ncbi:hypothetical protein BFJ69_g14939 [Fusarium oxysporum]|uniref:Uncharacterized protein n=1 Tax=Fusarium oxysporum TaxID=5507 RepID=A0A420MG11_FUSOX|nr:hypothetical protein BFJ69_g14939 [Fusarium oxysporum]
MLSALILNQLSFPAVPMLYIYLSERNIPMYSFSLPNSGITGVRRLAIQTYIICGGSS